MAENTQLALENIVSAAGMGAEYIFEDIRTGLYDLAEQKKKQFDTNLPQSAFEYGLLVGELATFLKISLNELIKSRSLGLEQKAAVREIRDHLEKRMEVTLESIAEKIELVDNILQSIKS